MKKKKGEAKEGVYIIIMASVDVQIMLIICVNAIAQHIVRHIGRENDNYKGKYDKM